MYVCVVCSRACVCCEFSGRFLVTRSRVPWALSSFQCNLSTLSLPGPPCLAALSVSQSDFMQRSRCSMRVRAEFWYTFATKVPSFPCKSTRPASGRCPQSFWIQAVLRHAPDSSVSKECGPMATAPLTCGKKNSASQLGVVATCVQETHPISQCFSPLKEGPH